MPSTEFNTKGTFADVVLPALLVQAMNARFTGMFRAERESIIKVIYFKEGDIAFASSNQPSDRLGEVLIKRGQLTREQLDMAMSKLEANVSLGRMLVELGYLSPKELLAGAKAQVEEILFSLNTWREGSYEFVEGPLAPRIVDLKLSMRQVVFQSIMQLEDRTWVLQQIGSMESAFAANPDLTEALGGMKLEPEILQIASMIDGTNTVRDLCARSALDEFTVTKAATALYLLNLTHISESETQDQFLSPFGGQSKSSEATTIVGGGSASETVPGFGTFGTVTEQTHDEEEEFSHRSTAELPVDEVISPARLDDEPSGDEELNYEEEEHWDDEEVEDVGGGRKWLMPALGGLILVGALGGAAWMFRDSLPFIGGGGEEASPVAGLDSTPTPAVTDTPAVVGTPSRVPTTTPTSLTSTATGTPNPTPGQLAVVTPPPLPTAPMAPVTPVAVVTPTPRVAVAAGGTPPLPPPPPGRTPTQVAMPTPGLPPALPPTPAPTRVAAVQPPVQPPPRATPRLPPANSSAKGRDLSGAKSALDSGDYSAAGRSFRQTLAGESGYTLQLEIVCQSTSVREGWEKAGGASDYMILPFTYRGRSCYRVLWGLYASRTEAQRASTSVPAFFLGQLAGKPVPVVRLSAVR